MKAFSMISAVVFIAITISVMAIVYQAGMPIIDKMQSSAAMDRMTSAFTELDDTIQRVASEGNGSRRIFDLDSGKGRLSIDPVNDEISWQIEAQESVIRARSARYLGNVVSGSNLESSMYEGVHGSWPAYIMENAHLRVYMRKIETPQAYNTGTLLLDVYQKDLGEWLPFDYLNISLDDDPSSEIGTGWTEYERIGVSLPRASVTAHMESVYANYSVSFTMESGADFITIVGELE